MGAVGWLRRSTGHSILLRAVASFLFRRSRRAMAVAGAGAGADRRLTAVRLPFELRANDVVRHVVSVDSRFRDTPSSRESSPSDFYYTLLAPVRNVLRVRMVSVEFPNNYRFFTERRRNVAVRVLYTDPSGAAYAVVLTVPDGNYTAGDMVDALGAAILDASGSGAVPGFGALGLGVTFSESTGTFTFTGRRVFGLDMSWTGAASAPVGWVRPFDYGLGWYLGFTKRLHMATGSGTSWTLESDGCANFAGDNYVFVRVNDWACVRQTVVVYEGAGGTGVPARNDFVALAKVVLREPKNYMTFDDYAGQHAKEVVFPAPVDLTRLRIQVLDPYGEPVDLCTAQWSFSLEVLEVRNPLLFNALRDSLVAAAAGCGGRLEGGNSGGNGRGNDDDELLTRSGTGTAGRYVCFAGDGTGVAGGAVGP